MNNESKTNFKFSEVIIIVLITCTFSIIAGISYGKMKYSNTINVNNLNSNKEEDELNKFIKEYKYIISNFYDKEKIDENKLLKLALHSILDELGIEDSYSTYMDEDKYTQLNINLEGEYEGLGLSVYKEDKENYIMIISIMDGSPAKAANINEGDYILSIDGIDTKTMSTEDFSNYVLHSDEKIFLLKIKSGNEEKSIKLEKKKIELKSVDSKLIEKDNKKIGYITMSIFAANSYNQFKKNLTELEEKNIDALIIDLRNNNGGHLTEVTKILSLFLKKKRVIYQLQKDDNKVKYYSSGSKDKEYPIIFISNEYTASASEVFIISLKENLNAKLVGTKTYGKGTVQEMVDLGDGDQYKITTKKWLSPKGVWINDTKGIEPDVEVKDVLENDKDAQLEESINVAIDQIKK